MERDRILNTLRSHRDELRRIRVRDIAIFGSAAPDPLDPDSDVDVLVEFDAPVGLFHFARVQRRLEEWLGRSVDLVTPDALRPEMRDTILAEAVHAA